MQRLTIREAQLKQRFLSMDASQLKHIHDAGEQTLAAFDESQSDRKRREAIQARKAKKLEELSEQRRLEEELRQKEERRKLSERFLEDKTKKPKKKAAEPAEKQSQADPTEQPSQKSDGTRVSVTLH